MAVKKEKKVPRINAAMDLARLSGQVSDGFIEIGGKRAELPEYLVVKKVLKVKNNEVTFEFVLKVKADKVAGRGTEGKKAGNHKQSSRTRKDFKRPYKSKKLKKEISMLWKALKRCVKNGESFRDRKGFLRALEKYGKGAEKDWKADWERCVELVREVIELSKAGKRDEAADRCRQVDQLTKACHKKYK